MSPRHIPNLLSCVRILLVFPFTVWLMEGQLTAALLLFAVAALTDGVDGFLARHYGWQSPLGSVLDPLADKLLVAAGFIGLGCLNRIPLWLVLLVVARDLIIVTGSVAYYWLLRPFEGRPTRASKLNTLCQFLLVLLALLPFDQSSGVLYLLGLLTVLTAVTTLWSGIQYVHSWGMSYLRETRNPT